MTTPTNRPSSGIRMRPFRIVIVEDDTDARELVAHLVERDGHLVRAFAAAEDALREIGSACPDVVISDLQLGGMSGWALASALRASPRTSHVALLAVSGCVEPDWRVVRHFDAYLRKPVDAVVLSRLVSELADSAIRSRSRLEARG